MIPTRIPIRHYQMTKTILNYREILIVCTNNLLLRKSTIGAIMPRTSGLSGPSHANRQDRKPAHKTDISATIVKDQSYWYPKFITSVNILNKDESLLSNTWILLSGMVIATTPATNTSTAFTKWSNLSWITKQNNITFWHMFYTVK